MTDRPNVRLPAAALLSLSGFGAVVAYVLVSGGQTTGLDSAVLGQVAGWRSPALTALAQAITVLGSVPVVIGVAMLAAGLLAWRTRSWAAPALLTGAVAVTAGTVFLLKLAVGRLRPPVAQLIGTPSTDYSFPSGHTTDGTVVWVLAACLVSATLTRPAYRRLVVLAGAGIAVLVGLTRLYLGYHWFTDVLAGWLLAAAVVSAVLAAVEVLHRAEPTADVRPAPLEQPVLAARGA